MEVLVNKCIRLVLLTQLAITIVSMCLALYVNYYLYQNPPWYLFPTIGTESSVDSMDNSKIVWAFLCSVGQERPLIPCFLFCYVSPFVQIHFVLTLVVVLQHYVLCVQSVAAVFPESIALFITFFILFNNVVPISLYVTVEMVNFAQAHYIDNDIEMYVTSVMLHVVLLYCCTVVLLYCCTVVLLRSHSVPIQS
jgi:hypothetical protein